MYDFEEEGGNFWIARKVLYLDLGVVMAQRVKNLPATQETQETWVRSLGWEDPLKKEMATLSSILAWRVPWTEEPGRLQSMGCKGSDTTEQLTHTHIH